MTDYVDLFGGFAHYDAWKLASPPEGTLCPKCGDYLDGDGKCDDEACAHVVCCYPERCWCGDPRV